jgi:2-methylaconitate cis-trans-isomerase PrpF
MNQVPATYVRGGTSRALVFRSADLPKDRDLWPAVFARSLGSPDPTGYQLDGLGGGITSLSKVAVIDPVRREGSDIDYLFFQVDPRTGECSTRANCGNISSAVGPFALANGWIEPSGNHVEARIFNVNSSKVIRASFRTHVDDPERIAIHGVGGKAPPIRLAFMDPGGSVAPSLFPTGRRVEALRLSSGDPVQATLIDATVPTVIAMASGFGLTGDEPQPVLASNRALLDTMADLRIRAGLAMGLGASEQAFRSELWNLPDVVLVSKTAGPNRIRARFFSADAAHRAAPVTSSIALACAMSIQGCITEALVERAPSTRGEEEGWEIHHPSGTMDVWVTPNGDRTGVMSASVLRTARLLMQGSVLLEA